MSVSLAKYITQRSSAQRQPTVFVIALNSKQLLLRKQAELAQAPYNGAPKTPVIYVLPEATHNRSGAPVLLPIAQKKLRIEPHLGVVFAKDLQPVEVKQALDYVSAYLPAVLYSLPSDDYYRPDIIGRCQDSFCVLGQALNKSAVKNTEEIAIQVEVNNQIQKACYRTDTLYSVAELISFLSQFMSFKAGDVLLTGTEDSPAIAEDQDQVCVRFEQLGTLSNQILALSE
ncbi:fumarylacetoacetate hydrolase family protein [Conservatibacter flavescens]|uniref:Protein HpaG n=1 Tax=Conservatibacter flavescens TaxID=28161 RepID=A0A2M8S1U1_9PAST|nr:fumarylacetoacetate hydrolase family protein [Conservatibacter flavescens]PJG85084.1 protein HpaG [Conservatibacter flavescens]